MLNSKEEEEDPTPRYVGGTHSAPRSLPAPWGWCRERGWWASLSAAASLENRGGGPNEGVDGSGDCGGSPEGQLTVLLGAGLQVISSFLIFYKENIF